MAKRIQKKERLREKKLKTILWFLIKFNLLAIPLYIILFLNISFESLQILIAYITNETLKLFGYLTTQDGYFITTLIGNKYQLIEISWDSTGWKSLYALTALTLATPVVLKKKLKFLLIGLPALFLINYIRIVSTLLVAFTYGFQYFDIVHLILWREGLIIAVVVLWYLWIWKIKYNY